MNHAEAIEFNFWWNNYWSDFNIFVDIIILSILCCRCDKLIQI